MAQSLAVTHSYLPEQLKHVGTAEREEANLVVERRYVENVAARHGALAQRSAYAAHVVHGEVGLLVELCAAPHEYVGEKV